jgi:hypothetical protein
MKLTPRELEYPLGQEKSGRRIAIGVPRIDFNWNTRPEAANLLT